MDTGQYIQGKFQAWAERNGIRLQGSQGERGEPNYTLSVGQNIFGGALDDSVAVAFGSGAGGELRGDIPTLSALHSSAALAVNLFQYWVVKGDLKTLARLLDIPSRNIRKAGFECHFPVCADPQTLGFREPPHLDFAIYYSDGGCVAIECKLFEPYRERDHQLLRQPYLELLSAWENIPACRALAEQLTTSTAGFRRLDPSQLIKHILGLKFSAPIEKIRLLYIYYDAIGDKAAEHRQEIHQFQSTIANDPIRFTPKTVQEFILRAVQIARHQHSEYVDYLADRYL